MMEIHWGWIILGVIGLYFLGWVIAYDRAPMGWEDETGWHEGKPPER